MTVRGLLRGQWPIALVGLIFVAGFLLAGANFWRRGALLIGVGSAVAAVLRLVLSEHRAGLLAVRSKGIDFATTMLVAASMIYIAATIDPLGTG
jgi:hypothetical protein